MATAINFNFYSLAWIVVFALNFAEYKIYSTLAYFWAHFNPTFTAGLAGHLLVLEPKLKKAPPLTFSETLAVFGDCWLVIISDHDRTRFWHHSDFYGYCGPCPNDPRIIGQSCAQTLGHSFSWRSFVVVYHAKAIPKEPYYRLY